MNALSERWPPSPEQVGAWVSTIRALKGALDREIHSRPTAKDWQIVFEYELPREGGRRPDVCVVTESNVLVVEVKDSPQMPVSALEQCRGYVRDLIEYHRASRDLQVQGLVFIPTMKDLARHSDGLIVGGEATLPEVFASLNAAGMPAAIRGVAQL